MTCAQWKKINLLAVLTLIVALGFVGVPVFAGTDGQCPKDAAAKAECSKSAKQCPKDAAAKAECSKSAEQCPKDAAAKAACCPDGKAKGAKAAKAAKGECPVSGKPAKGEATKAPAGAKTIAKVDEKKAD